MPCPLPVWTTVVSQRIQALWADADAYPMTVFVAPAGWGKTTAANWWADRLQRPTIRLMLETRPALRQGAGLLRALYDDLCSLLGRPASAGIISADDCLDLLQALPSGLTVIVDDCHLAVDDSVAAIIEQLSEGGPDRHFLLTSRTMRALPALARWQARRRAFVISEAALRLDAAVVGHLLDLTSEELDQAMALTDGWPFAVIMLYQAKKQGIPIQSGLDPHLLTQYVLGEVLRGYPEDVLRFMQITALADRVDVADCLALGLTNADRALHQLLGDRLMIWSEEGTFSYHQLVRTALEQSLSPGERQQWQTSLGQHFWRQRDERCLPLLVATQDACTVEAIVWFAVNHWKETVDCPTVRAWMAQLPQHALQDDPWYLIVHHWLYRVEAHGNDHVALLQRAERFFAETGETFGLMVALYAQARWHDAQSDLGALRRVLTRVAALQQQWPHHEQVQLLALTVRANYEAFWGDLGVLEALLDQLKRWAPINPLAISTHCEIRLQACVAYYRRGNPAAVRTHWQAAIALLPRLPSYMPLACIGQVLVGPFLDDTDYLAADTTRRHFGRMRQQAHLLGFAMRCEGLDHWHQGHFDAALPLLTEAMAHGDRADATMCQYYLPVFAQVGTYLRRQGRLTEALATFERGHRPVREIYPLCEFRWHWAQALAAAGRTDEALAKLDAVDRDANEQTFRFWQVASQLLRCQIEGRFPAPSLRATIALWGYDPVIRRHLPELAPLLRAAEPMLTIRTLGGFQVMAAGTPVRWKRQNSHIVLLDLLLHQEGSSALALENRYWPSTGSSTLRNDIRELRLALDPGGPADRYVAYAEKRYRWVADHAVYDWDAGTFEAMATQILAHPEAPHASRLALQVLEAYHGDFVPELAGYPVFARYRDRLRELADRLRQLIDAGR